jgi:hypothetical protein
MRHLQGGDWSADSKTFVEYVLSRPIEVLFANPSQIVTRSEACGSQLTDLALPFQALIQETEPVPRTLDSEPAGMHDAVGIDEVLQLFEEAELCLTRTIARGAEPRLANPFRI